MVYVDVSCEVEWGSIVCVQVFGFLYGFCFVVLEEWSGGSFVLIVECVEEEVVFMFCNNGDGIFLLGSIYIII